MRGVQMRAAAGDAPARLTLMGDVGWDITAAGVAAALREVREGAPLLVSLNSYGGDALQGIAVHNMLARHKGQKTVVVEGIAASAASLIAMAGDSIVMPANAFLMIHEAWGGALGDAETMRSQAEVLDRISAAYRRTYAARTGLAEEEVGALMAAETWLTAEDALARGFATEVAEPAEVRAFAAFPADRFPQAPAALRALAASAVSTPPASPPAQPEEVRVTVQPNPAGNQPPAAPTVDPAAAAPAPVAPRPAAPASAASIAELRAIADRNGLDAAFALDQLERGATREAALEAALDAVAARAPAPVATPGMRVLRDGAATARARMAAAFAAGFSARLLGRPAEYAEDQREFAGIGLHAVMRELLVMAGERSVHRMDPTQLVERILAYGSHTTSDFPGVLANTLNKTVRDLYTSFPNTWSAWCDEVEVADYKQITAATVGQASELQPVGDGGQIVYGTIAEDVPETYQVIENGLILPIGKQALVNDDMRALEGSVRAIALAAYTRLRRVVFGILTTNANMADGIALFAAGHNNLDTAAALSATTYGNLRNLLNAQTGPARSGHPVPPLPPVTNVALLAGTARERVALELLGPTIVPNAVGNALPMSYRSTTDLVIDPFLNVTSGGPVNPYYLARTNPGLRPVEIAYIRGRRQPEVTSAEKIDYTGIMFRCIFDFNAKSVTWRTAAANLGA